MSIETLLQAVDELIEQMSDFKVLAEEKARQSEVANTREIESTSRIRGWVVAANAGALLICFNSMLRREICDWEAFQPLVVLFVVGVASTFGAVVADRQHNSYAARVLNKARLLSGGIADLTNKLKLFRTHIERGELDHASKSLQELRNETAAARARAQALSRASLSYRLSGFLETCGIAALGLALVWAVSDARFLGSLCPAP